LRNEQGDDLGATRLAADGRSTIELTAAAVVVATVDGCGAPLPP
jgi:hypothetical protein